MFEIPRNYILSKGYINDGAVPWQSCILSGMNFVTIAGADHSSTVTRSYFVNLNRVRTTKTIFVMLQKRMSEN